MATERSHVEDPTHEDPIVVRRLSVADDPDRAVTVMIGKPHPNPDGNWTYPFRVDGIAGARGVAHGIDGLQALDAYRKLASCCNIHYLFSSGLMH